MPPIDDKTTKRDIRDLVIASGTVRANFVVLAGEDIGHKYEINKSEMMIGRAEDVDIFIDDQDVSRYHAKVEIQADAILITDLSSTNGTMINGKPVAVHRLDDGDRIQIGSHTILKFNFLDNLEENFNERLYNAANKDFLTQIYNKKFFLDRLRTEFSYSRRHEVPLSLIIFDLDHFKNVNDKYGHVAGDQALKEISNQINAIKRQEDLFARFGGEEFVLLLRDTSRDSAEQIAEKIRAKIEDLDFVYDGHKIPITISVGVATLNDNNFKNHESFFRTADDQLLLAKRAGRNRVCVAPQDEPDRIKAKLG